MREAVTVDLGGFAGGCSFRTTALEPIDPELFDELARAVQGRRRILIRYWTPSRDAESDREVDPYHLACIDGRWYLVGFCHSRGEILTFVPARIRALQTRDATFERPVDFRIDEYLAGAFGVFRGGDGETHRVRLRFTGESARYVRNRTWHPSQTAEPTDDGALILSFDLGALQEVERWALSWGADCEVLGPPESRSRVAAAVASTSEVYSGKEVIALRRR